MTATHWPNDDGDTAATAATGDTVPVRRSDLPTWVSAPQPSPILDVTATMRVPKLASLTEGLPSAMVGPYMLSDVLGRGGAATVYRARHTDTGDEVALKVLDRGRTQHQGVERFHEEIAICAPLHHPNIVRTYASGSHGDHLFHAMELLKGQDLGTLLDDAPSGLPIDRVLGWAIQVCDGLIYAHDAGVIHRDIKPHNLFLVGDDRIKIMDFGIARRLTVSITETADPSVLGTPVYLPPERFSNKRLINERTDVYSLGTSLYHLLTGAVPFDLTDMASLVGSIMFGDVAPPSTLNPAIDLSLDAIVMTAMQRDNRARYVDCRAMRQALQSARSFLSGGEL